MRNATSLLAAAIVVLLPAVASAHVGTDATHGLLQGLSNPLSGIDHVLAMVAVGLFAAHLGGGVLYFVPAAFIAVMALAGVAGSAGVDVPLVEFGIGTSIVVLGFVVAFQLNVPTAVAAALVGFFAIFHGHAHGTEIPEAATGITYGIGFVCATALLHAIGIGLGLGLGRAGHGYGRRILQAGGWTMSLAGVAILCGLA
jgi:urease accessory protein